MRGSWPRGARSSTCPGRRGVGRSGSGLQRRAGARGSRGRTWRASPRGRPRCRSAPSGRGCARPATATTCWTRPSGVRGSASGSEAMGSGTSSRNSPPPTEDGSPDGPVAVPSHAALAELLDRHADFGPAPLSPEIRVFQARGLVEIWEAAERLAGRTLPPPFWAYPWPGGAALARVVLDHPEWIAGRRVLDLGTGGGISALAAARAGAALVVANDLDPWALDTARLAADRQGLELTPLLEDL